jgi:hypothetical protein
MNLFCFLPISYSAAMQNEQNPSGSDDISIYQIAPDKRGGKAYKLVYLVSVQMDVVWRFKTDQVGYFDFIGSSIWANYPWGRGLKDFLSYTAHREQKTIMHLRNRHYDKNSK